MNSLNANEIGPALPSIVPQSKGHRVFSPFGAKDGDVCMAIQLCLVLRLRNGGPKSPKPFLIFCWPCSSLWCLVNDNLTYNSFSMYLFQFSTCFEQPRAHHLLLLPIALRPFQFGLAFPYNWRPFHSIQRLLLRGRLPKSARYPLHGLWTINFFVDRVVGPTPNLQLSCRTDVFCQGCLP
jgi:hypothetical protein